MWRCAGVHKSVTPATPRLASVPTIGFMRHGRQPFGQNSIDGALRSGNVSFDRRASSELPPLPGRTSSGRLNPTGSGLARPTEDWPSDASDVSSVEEVLRLLCSSVHAHEPLSACSERRCSGLHALWPTPQVRAAQDVGRDDIGPQDPVGEDADASLTEGALRTPRSGSGDGADAEQALNTVRPWEPDPPDNMIRGPCESEAARRCETTLCGSA